MKLTNKFEMSAWAFSQCLNGNDTKEMRDLITFPTSAYLYCKSIRNLPEMREKVNCQKWRFRYKELCMRAKNETYK